MTSLQLFSFPCGLVGGNAILENVGSDPAIYIEAITACSILADHSQWLIGCFTY